MVVKAGIKDANIISSNEFDALEEAVGTIGKYQNQIDTINRNIGGLDSLTTFIKTSVVSSINWLHEKFVNAIAKEWKSGNYVMVGDYNVFQGGLYRCVVANQDVNFDVSKWRLEKVGDLLKSYCMVTQNTTDNLIIGKTSTLIPFKTLVKNNDTNIIVGADGVINLQPGVYLITIVLHGVVSPNEIIKFTLENSDSNVDYSLNAEVRNNSGTLADQFIKTMSGIINLDNIANIYLTGSSLTGTSFIYSHYTSPRTQLRIKRLG